jgi:hypothetical protein
MHRRVIQGVKNTGRYELLYQKGALFICVDDLVYDIKRIIGIMLLRMIDSEISELGLSRFVVEEGGMRNCYFGHEVRRYAYYDVMTNHECGELNTNEMNGYHTIAPMNETLNQVLYKAELYTIPGTINSKWTVLYGYYLNIRVSRYIMDIMISQMRNLHNIELTSVYKNFLGVVIDSGYSTHLEDKKYAFDDYQHLCFRTKLNKIIKKDSPIYLKSEPTLMLLIG